MNKFLNNKQQHGFHLVTSSPWPFVTSISALVTVIGAVMYMHFVQNGGMTFALGLVMLVLSLSIWWRDVIRESTFEGMHTKLVQKGLRIGFILFIVSEIMFFFAFFWAYFHVSIDPTVEIGSIWPPTGITVLDPWGIPFLNTYILVMSGVLVTIAHHNLMSGNALDDKSEFLRNTIILAISFVYLQYFEYCNAPFSISDGVYGSTFYMTTGFHGLHVIIGTIFLYVCRLRFSSEHFTKQHHFGFEAAVWYWHFVDVVWLFLFVSIYWWGSY